VFEGAVLVFSGSFNPAIFHPGWLVSVGLASEDEGLAAKVKHSDSVLSRFEIVGVGVDVRPDQLTVASIDATLPEVVRELAVGMLRLLPHSVAQSVGMSRAAHASPAGGFAKLAARLTPADALAGVLDDTDLKMLTVEGRLPGDSPVTLTVEPSGLADHGVYVVATKSLTRPDGETSGADWATDGIDATWFPWMDDADKLIRAVLALADEDTTGT
jgi:hypothetical protein